MCCLARCLRCPAGTYQGLAGASSVGQCLACPSDPATTGPTTSTAGSASEEDCTCAPGHVNDTGLSAGGVVAGEAWRCVACPVGQYKEGIGKGEQCVECPANSNTSSSGSVSVGACECVAGYEGEIRSADVGACLPCPRGTYKGKLGSVPTQSCSSCPDGQYQDEPASTACLG